MAFIQRKLNVTFKLASGSFDEGGNQATFKGLRISSKITKAGGRSMSMAELSIYGLTDSVTNKLSTLGMKVQFVQRNTITIEAGTDSGGFSTVFQGNVTNAYADRQNPPANPFRITAHAGLYEAVNTSKASSYNGSTDVATVMSNLASQAGLQFENNDVKVQLSDPYFYGSARNQIYECAAAAGINAIIDNGKLAIWNKNGARKGQIPLISKETGLVTAPAFTAQGIGFKTIFNPGIEFGKKIQMQSSIQTANGIWAVYLLDYELDSNVPKGNWFCQVSATNPNFAPAIGR
jgi:hypothetical protein